MIETKPYSMEELVKHFHPLSCAEFYTHRHHSYFLWILTPQIMILHRLLPHFSIQAPLRNLDILIDILYQTLHRHVITLRPYISKNTDRHFGAIEIFREFIEYMDLLF